MVKGSVLSVRISDFCAYWCNVHLLSPPFPSPLQFWSSRMITDVQLAMFANILGVTLFLLVVLYHYIAANNPKKKEE